MTRMALGPKYTTAIATTGTRLTTTDHMIFGVVSGALMCGEAVISKRGVSITPPSPFPACPCREAAAPGVYAARPC